MASLTDATDLTWPLRTERLEISPLVEADLPDLHAFRGRPEVQEWVGSAHPTLEAFAAQAREPVARGSRLTVREDGRVVGDLMVLLGDGWSQREARDRAAGVEALLGWTLDPAHGGRGLATEAVRAAIGLCFEGLGLRRVVAECFADNTASWRLMERVGMRREAHGVRDSLHRSRGWLDGYRYALLADEWRAEV